ncbi:hypothetical protein ACGF1Z_35245 [Streptomyces sp. NPDC048018]|uniref:hypothetical protein n=1 Tax=Streptomyces sp. NPDC048018 TaxID=3365499 RepID=UPI003722022E
MDVGQGPVLFVARAGQEAGEITDDGQGRFDGAVGARQSAGLESALSCPQHEFGERLDLGLKREWGGVDMALAASGGEPVRLVGRQGEATLGEEAFECAGEGAHRPAGAASAIQQGLGVVGVFVVQQSAQCADHGAGATCAVPVGEMTGEVTQPGHGLYEPRGQVLGGDEGAVGVLLPAG